MLNELATWFQSTQTLLHGVNISAIDVTVFFYLKYHDNLNTNVRLFSKDIWFTKVQEQYTKKGIEDEEEMPLFPALTYPINSHTCIDVEIDSRSERISAKFLVPNTFRSVVAAKSRVERSASSTFVIATTGL